MALIIFAPKKDFQALPEASVFRDFTGTTNFQKALLYGLQHYTDQVTTNMPEGAIHRIQGAREFAQCLLNLTEPVEEPKKTPVKSLNYQA